MLEALAKVFTTNRSTRCCGRGSRILAERRELLHERYAARPLDDFPNRYIAAQTLGAARARADLVDQDFQRYKREVGCLGKGDQKLGGRALGKCVKCQRWTCNVRWSRDRQGIVHS